MSEVRTFLIEPFDIMLHATEEGVQSLQARFSTWLRTLREPARSLVRGAYKLDDRLLLMLDVCTAVDVFQETHSQRS